VSTTVASLWLICYPAGYSDPNRAGLAKREETIWEVNRKEKRGYWGRCRAKGHNFDWRADVAKEREAGGRGNEDQAAGTYIWHRKEPGLREV
jgi:hypothetical protein